MLASMLNKSSPDSLREVINRQAGMISLRSSKMLLLLLLLVCQIPMNFFTDDPLDDSDNGRYQLPLDPSLDWYRPYDLVSFNVSQDNYRDLISQICGFLLPRCTNKVNGRRVLPQQRYDRKPFRWLMVELLAAADNKIVLAVRQDNLYIAGFTNKLGFWYTFSNKVDLNLIPTAYGLRFADDYGSLVGGHRTLRQARFGRETTLLALHEIANYEPNSAADDGSIMRAVATMAVTVCEATRFTPIFHSIRDFWVVGVDLGSLADYVVKWRIISCAVLISRQNNNVWGTNSQDDEARQLARDLKIHNRDEALAVVQLMLWPKRCSQQIN